MRIGIDNISPGLSTSRNALGGMRHFLQSLITHLPERGLEHEYLLFAPVGADPLNAPPGRNLRLVNCSKVPKNRLGRVLYEQLSLPGQIRRNAVSVWVGTCNTLPLRLACCSVLFVQSLQYFTFPEAYTWPQRLYLRALAPASLRRADQLIAFSQASKDYVIRRFGIDPGKVAVIHHGLRFSRETVMKSDTRNKREMVRSLVGDSDYILCVSAFYRYKNLIRLLEAFARLKPDFHHKLVIVGAETKTLTQANLKALAHQLGVETDVIFPGRVPDEQLVPLYQQAALMAMPSLDETFGYPVLEAMALGCPVVTSNVSSMAEIAGEFAVLVDPYQVESIAEGLRRLLSSSDLRQQMVEAGRARAQLFTTERFFEQLMEVINAVCDSTRVSQREVKC